MATSTQMRRSTPHVFVLGVFLIFFSSAVTAETAGVLEEIIVTATKRATLLQETPESITALSADFLRDIGAEDFASYFRMIPSLDQSDNRGPGNTRYSLRGVVSGGEPLVSVYLDEVPALGSPEQTLDAGGSQADVKLWDIERIEVLKGPQGTLYGRDSMGGTIRIISKKPDASGFDFASKVDVETTRHGGWGTSAYGMINMPLIEDQLALRLTAYHRDIDGFIDEIQYGDNDANSEKTTGGRLALRWTPTEKLTVTATAYYQDSKTGSDSNVYQDLTKQLGTPSAQTLTHQPFDDEYQLYDLTAEYSFGWADLLYTGSYQKREVHRVLETSRLIIFELAGLPREFCPESALLDRSCFDLINAGPFGLVVPAADAAVEIGKDRIHEVRLTSDLEGPLDWTAGLFYENRDNTRWGQVAVADASGDIVFDQNGVAQNRIFSRFNHGDREQYAFFGELGYEFVPNWKASLGVRWFKTERLEEQNLIQNFGPGPTGPQVPSSFSKSDWVKRYKISWDATDDTLFYALAAEGFRTGGPNQPVGFDVSAPPFDADGLWNYEFGWKTSWLDDALRINGAVYYIDWTSIQFITSDPTGVFTLIGNGGDAEVKGMELSLQARPMGGLEVSAAVGYARARFTGEQPRQGLLANQTEDGDRLPGVPDWSTTLYAQYTQPLGDSWEAFFGGDWAYRSSKTTGFRPEAGNFKELPSYHQVNLRGSVADEHWRVTLSVDNLFDELAQISGRILRSDPVKFATIWPRTVGLSVSYTY